MAKFKATKGVTTAASAKSNVPANPATEYLAQVNGQLDAIILDTNALDTALSGDAGFQAVKARATGLRPSLAAMTVWDAGKRYFKDNAMESAIVQAHDLSGAASHPAILAEYRDACFLASHAADDATFKGAYYKVGPNGPMVGPTTRQRTNLTPHDYASDKARFNVKDAADARAMIAKRADAANKALAALGGAPTADRPIAARNAWRDAQEVATLWSRCAGTHDSLVWLAAKENATKQAVGKWRKRLFIGVAEARLAEFEGRVTTKSAAQIWEPAAGALIAAQKDWFAKQFADTADDDAAKQTAKREAVLAELPLRVDSLAKALGDALNEYLSPFETGEVKARKESKESELVNKLYRAAAACERHFAIKGKALQREILAATYRWHNLGLLPSNADEDELARIRDTAVRLQMIADTNAAATSAKASTTSDAAKRQAELDAKGAKDAADKQASGPTPSPTPPVTTPYGATPPAATPPAATPPAAAEGAGARIRRRKTNLPA